MQAVKILTILAVLTLPLCAQNLTIGTTDVVGAAKALYRLPTHPKRSFVALKQHPLAMMSASLTLGLVNGADALTTWAGPGSHPSQFCEQIVTSAPCVLDKRKFDWLKGSIAAWDLLQWAPVVFTPHWEHLQAYEATVTLMDGAMTIPLAKAVAGNLSALQAKGYGIK